MAGAGTGKTRALVERCLHCLLNEQPRASLDEILVVTFTEAAAAEMRQRIRSRLLEESTSNPQDCRWQEQLALFETAHIGTLHSFCLKLIRQHFYELELDPQLSVLPEEEARLLAEETLEALMQKYYQGNAAMGEAVQRLIQTHGKGSDQPVRDLILRLHNYTQTLPSPQGWFAGQLEVFSKGTPDAWRVWFASALSEWRTRAAQVFGEFAPKSELARNCLAAISGASQGSSSSADEGFSVRNVMEAAQHRTGEAKSARPAAIQACLDEAGFLLTLIPNGSTPEPLQQDWEWSSQAMATLVQLAAEFSTAFAQQKRELGAVD